MNYHKTTLPPSYQKESNDENNSTKEALDQVNPNTNPQQFVQMPPVVITNPPSTSINQASETNRQAYYCNYCCTLTDVWIKDSFSQCTYIWACVLFCFASPLLTWVPFRMSGLKENTVYCRRCQKPIESTQKNRTRANIILTVVLLIGFTVSVSLLIWRILASNQSYRYGK